ncbi:MAG: zf-HC2 domain-containing protein, partial [Candidatus Saccharicenans sp.]|nr:zf-HC2 domain-containing protein [Candidatus Saccharicenans sp.]
MNCRKAQRFINELLDGELRERDRGELQAHLDRCARCRQLYEELAKIKERVVPTGGMEPSDRVWQNLKNRLQAEVIPQLQAETTGPVRERTGRRIADLFRVSAPAFKYALASLVLVAFIAGAFYLGRYYQKSGQPELQLASLNLAIQKLQEAEFYYQKAVQSLTQALESSENGLPPEMAEILQANLGLLDRTIDLARQAVNDQPDNLQAREYLLSA